MFGAVMTMILLAAACASSTTKDPGVGTRTLDCMVVERGSDGSGSSGASSRDPGNYYLVFEAKEGQATSRYRYSVTQQQWIRFHEGDRVKITLNNNMLTDIRLLTD
jgi:hypothetical protein